MGQRWVSWLIPGGGLLGIVCFFLPWVKIGRTVISGPVQGGFLWLLLGLSVLILGSFMAGWRWEVVPRLVVIFAAMLGLVIMVIVFQKVWSAKIWFIRVDSIMDIRLQAAGVGMALSYLLAFIGAVSNRGGDSE